MPHQNYGWLDIEFTTNKKIEGNGAVKNTEGGLIVDWFAGGDGSRPAESVSAPADSFTAFRPMESLQQGFDLI